ncbi:MAG: anti-sigma factor family protein [Thermoanaerobaculia bacterium]
MSLPDRFTCDEVFRRLDLYLDRTLGPEELRRVQEHLETCAECAGEYRFEESLLAEVRRKVGRIDLPAGLAERIAARLGPPRDES